MPHLYTNIWACRVWQALGAKVNVVMSGHVKLHHPRGRAEHPPNPRGGDPTIMGGRVEADRRHPIDPPLVLPTVSASVHAVFDFRFDVHRTRRHKLKG